MKEAWDRRDEPNMCLVYYEDLKVNPVQEISRIDRFIGTNRTPIQIEKVK